MSCTCGTSGFGPSISRCCGVSGFEPSIIPGRCTHCDGSFSGNPPIVGFTGTRRGLTAPQLVALRRLLFSAPIGELHHGGCIGADDQADTMAHDLRIPRLVYPSSIGPNALISIEQRTARGRSFGFTVGGVAFRPADLPLVRNREIVDACDVLIACPSGPEQIRSGTWYTVRYARKIGRPVVLIFPEGGA